MSSDEQIKHRVHLNCGDRIYKIFAQECNSHPSYIVCYVLSRVRVTINGVLDWRLMY
jgi:hypothetical protein